jgi:hypothetical protein
VARKGIFSRSFRLTPNVSVVDSPNEFGWGGLVCRRPLASLARMAGEGGFKPTLLLRPPCRRGTAAPCRRLGNLSRCDVVAAPQVRPEPQQLRAIDGEWVANIVCLLFLRTQIGRDNIARKNPARRCNLNWCANWELAGDNIAAFFICVKQETNNAYHP